MLIVARRKGQRILIGRDIEIVVTDVSKTTVKIGIVAPKTCSILRGEVHATIAEANRKALETSFEPASPASTR